MGSGSKAKRQRNATVDFLVYAGFRTLLSILQALPERACLYLAKLLAWVFCDVIRFRETVVMDNLRHAFPEASAARRQAICRGMWQHLMLLIGEIARASRKIHETNWRDYVSIDGCRALVASQLNDRPVIIVTAHLGNFEISGYVAGLLGFANLTVARPLDNPFLREFFMQFRQSTGQRIIPSRGSAELVGKAVEEGCALAILGDHYGGPKGCWVEFFHRPASCHKSIALLALKYDVPLLVFNSRRIGRMLHFKMTANDDVLDSAKSDSRLSITETTQWYTRRIESAIRECPEQYWWLHRRWKDTRANLRRIRKEKRAMAKRRIDDKKTEPISPHPQVRSQSVEDVPKRSSSLSTPSSSRVRSTEASSRDARRC